jgi:AraC-like DNA-binding protein
MTQLASPPADPVSEVLRSFGVRSSIFCVSELRAPWAFRVEGEQVAKFHLLLDGCALLFCGAESVPLAPGDLAVLPRGTEHTLADDGDSPAAPLRHLLAQERVNGGSRVRYGGDGAVTKLLCGGFSLADSIPVSTLSLFPDVLHVGYDASVTPWLATVLAELRREAESDRPGADAILAKITDVFLAQALRTWLLQGERDGLADARLILDEPIAKAVRVLNSRSSEPWSLDRLGRHVGLSRTALAIKFRERVGKSPMQYLSDVRLRQAAESLAGGRSTLRQVASEAGYVSDAAFAKAFKRHFGVTPGVYRESANRPPQIEIAALP